eukprot:2507833-Alexandrium_andersonii.AAC.1
MIAHALLCLPAPRAFYGHSHCLARNAKTSSWASASWPAALPEAAAPPLALPASCATRSRN